MKTLLFLVLLGLGTVTIPAWADAIRMHDAVAQSPDHPQTWVVGADVTHKSLRWDAKKHLLFADVTYSTIAYATNTLPTETADYSLAFPDVHYETSTRQFKSGGHIIGTLEDGFLDSRVALNKGLMLEVHRQHGYIVAAIVPELLY